jgi:hypothetical protein
MAETRELPVAAACRCGVILSPLPPKRISPMKARVSPSLVAAALATATVFASPCAAMPAAPLAAVSAGTPIHKVNGVRHHYHRHRLRLPPIEVYPGLYYDCRPGWYCFGPPLRPTVTRAWYGGFNSIYGYQGARWRPPSRDTGS